MWDSTFTTRKSWWHIPHQQRGSIFMIIINNEGCPGGSDGKESACNAGDLSSVPGLGRSSGEGNGNPLQYSCLENSTDRGAWPATVNGVQRVGHDWATNTHIHNEGQSQCQWASSARCPFYQHVKTIHIFICLSTGEKNWTTKVLAVHNSGRWN